MNLSFLRDRSFLRELLIIAIPKVLAGTLLYRDGERVDISLVVYGETFLAGIRTTSRFPNVHICPDLVDTFGNAVKLAEVIYQHGLDCCKVVNLSLFDSALHCYRGTAQDIRNYQDMGWLGRLRESAQWLREKRPHR